ncbi:hypothetical protein KVR01_007420 [Diaporthe batatas]|uniref:uncharacterized protein n=1 Tax=Diaporthe batatas TaxID=748121 RepID=UPI001D0374A2|nr:uncharacterized protein KVR01_007420 [Diaporthe batatas]KAG8162942.1 hypothetical protein KVR01_007420 [Diaporthe batatas]
MITLLTAVGTVPTIIGTTQAIEHGQRQNTRKQHRGRRSNLAVTLERKGPYSTLFEGAKVVLRANKLYVEAVPDAHAGNQDQTTQGPSIASDKDTEAQQNTNGHLFSGFYLPHPVLQEQWAREGLKGEGLVSTIRDDPPDLNWIYVDRDTFEVKYGSRAESAGHLLGPWDCTVRERRVTFEGWEGFLAVEDEPEAHPGAWALYFDRNNYGLQGRAVRSVAVLLCRREPLRSRGLRDEEAGRGQRTHENE